MDIVVDCSVSSAWFLNDETSLCAENLLKEIVNNDIRLIQPSIWLYETLNCLRSAVIRKRISSSEARNALFHLHELPIDYIAPESQGEFNIIEKALKHNLSAYDAAYLDLAEKRGLKLYTGDKDLAELANTFSFIQDIRNFKNISD